MPKTRKIMGYIVSGSCGVMGVTAYEDGIIVLCYGNGAYMFTSLRAAKAAIARTLRYAEKRKFAAWDKVHTISWVTQ